ncbi:endonuclease/exonuclease/phosphatase family protein [Babesia divergens]|uniref:Endonuclease/exonuclease/phosphatase family protein n=1 Tax=Babesia divergens TaxID=32595 RepID=A0AAD9GJS8_BABDI|nr:endonuclease/exonuclease/phosphatase family protein [Babesia divergens]
MADLLPVTVMSYNVQGLPNLLLRIGNLSERLNHIAKYIQDVVNKYGVDILIVQELFSAKLYKKIKKRLESIMAYDTRSTKKVDSADYWAAISKPIFSWFSLIQGGVMIFSKHPIVDKMQLVFTRGLHADKLVSKGAVLARVRINDRLLDVVGVHLQAHDGTQEHNTRKTQVAQLVEWLSYKPIGTFPKVPQSRAGGNVPLVIAGDLNSCFIHDKDEAKELLDSFKAVAGPIFDTKMPTASYSTLTNDFCDFQNKEITYDHVYDYILTGPSVEVIQPQRVVTDKIGSPLAVHRRTMWFIKTGKRKINHASDHFPVYAILGLRPSKFSPVNTK